MNNPGPRTFGKIVHHQPVVDSTNNEAMRHAKEGAAEGEVFIADQQTSGRGRSSRTWDSPPSKNLYLSIILRPPLKPDAAVPLTLMAAASLFDTILPVLPESLRPFLKIKWPNDLILNGKKIAGILCEMDATPEKVNWVVCGIGFNINSRRSDFSPEIQERVTSLKIETGKEFDRGTLTTRLLGSLEERYFEFCENGPAETISFCDHYSYLQGKRILWNSPKGLIKAIAKGLDSRGFLMLQTEEKKPVTVVSGDITLEN